MKITSFFRISLIWGLMAAPALSVAQQSGDRPGLTLGLHLNETGQHYGLGLNASTPSFARGNLALRASGTMQYYEVPATTESAMEWSRFAQVRLGLVSYAPVCACGIRAYGETGPLAIRPHTSFSNGNWQMGWYGLFGAEFLMSSSSLFFFEMGGQGASNKNAGIPAGYQSFGNGFMASAGFRLQFGSASN
ncbi:MAG: hypothetical protein EAZ89_17965 [Bacteroidetes bacterium]|nr:MAG: hypothetical protein EAZ89_17965 [Bacteroidota bacterium]